MERARELRENAAWCARLSMSINAPADVAWLEALAAEATQAAERIETEEAADGAARSPGYPEPPDVSPVLMSVLREDGTASLSGTPDTERSDDLSATRGIIIWALISAAMWSLLVWWIVGWSR